MWNQELQTSHLQKKEKRRRKKTLFISLFLWHCLSSHHGFLSSGHNLSCTQLQEAALLSGSLVSWNFTHSWTISLSSRFGYVAKKNGTFNCWPLIRCNGRPALFHLRVPSKLVHSVGPRIRGGPWGAGLPWHIKAQPRFFLFKWWKVCMWLMEGSYNW